MEPEPIGGIKVFGDRDRHAISRNFVEHLGELPPTRRRLALALACALPWRDRPDELPGCYERELALAAWEADAEDSNRDIPASVETEAFMDPENPPVSEVFLRQLIPLGPSRRRALLLSVCRAFWAIEYRSPPEWLARSSRHASGDEGDEYRLIKDR